jgi:hypothetical protein
LHTVFAAKLVNTSGSIQHFLLASEKRMTFGTYFNVHVSGVGRTGLEFVPATASDRNFLISGVYICFHG